MISEIAVYKGKEYDATILTDDVCLRSKSSEDLHDGFAFENGVYCKKVPISEIEAAYRIEKYAIIDGIRCSILGETANEVTVIFENVSDDSMRYYGLYEAYDRGMYKKTYPKFGMDYEIVRKEYDLKTHHLKQTEPERKIVYCDGAGQLSDKHDSKAVVRNTDSMTENVARFILQKSTANITFFRMNYEEWFKFDIKIRSDGNDKTYCGSVGVVSNSKHDIVLVNCNANELMNIIFRMSGRVLSYEEFNMILQYAKQNNYLSDKAANKCFKKAYQMRASLGK